MAMVSVGDYLYAAQRDSTGSTALSIVRINKLDGTKMLIAGFSAGHADGAFYDAQFAGVTGIASDGKHLYAADSGAIGAWLRKIRKIKRPVDLGGPTLPWETAGGGNPAECNCNASYADPIQTDTGALFEPATDLSVLDHGGELSMSRTYSSATANIKSVVGYGWAWPFGMNVKDMTQYSTVVVSQENGSAATFTKQADGTYKGAPRLQATLVKNADGTWTFARRQQITMTFNAAGKITRQVARNGRVLNFTYNGSGQLTAVTGASGRALAFSYDAAGYLETVTAPSGAQAVYTQDASGNLTKVVDPTQAPWLYDYDTRHLLTKKTNPRLAEVSNEFDTAGRVVKQTQALNRVWKFDYTDGDEVGTSTVTITAPGDVKTYEEYVDGQLRKQIQAVGTPDAATTRWEYDPVTSRPVTIIGPDDTIDRYTYDAAGNKLTHTDPLERLTKWSYSSAGDLLSESLPGQSPTEYTYDARGNRLSAATPSGKVTTFTYNSDSTLKSAALPGRPAATYDYYANGDLKSVKDPVQRETTYAYDLDGRVQDMTDALEHTTHKTYDGAGRLKTVKDALEHITKFDYYPDGTAYSTTDAEEDTSYTIYDLAGRLEATKDTAGKETTYDYDAADRLDKVTKPNGNTVSYTYDGRGNMLTEKTAAGITGYTYDLQDRLVATKTPDEHITRTKYNDAGEVDSTIDAREKKTSYTHDGVGRLLDTTDPNDRVTKRTYTADGQLDVVSNPDTGTIDYEYYDDGTLKSVKNPDGGITSYDRNAAGQTEKRTLPGGAVTKYTYDEVGRSRATIENDDTSVTREYDHAGRMTDLKYSDSATPSVHYEYDSTGRRTLMTDGTGATSYLYDDAGRLHTATNSAGAVGYTYDHAGLLKELTYPGGDKVTYKYDGAGRMTDATDWNDQITSFTWTDDGQLDTQTTPDGVVSNTDYDNNGAVTDIKLTHGQTTLGTFSYSYDDAGQLTSSTKPSSAHTYTYTGTRQIASITTTSGLGDTGQYTVTPGGLIKGIPDGTTHEYDTKQQLTTSTAPNGAVTSYGFDSRGNRTTADLDSQSKTYTYDLANRLTGVNLPSSGEQDAQQVGYAYNGNGLRVTRTADDDTTSFVWSTAGDMPLLLADGTHRYLYGPGLTPYAQVAADGTTEYLHTDQQGTVTHITNTDGDVTGTNTYDPYGRLLNRDGAAHSNIGYTGAWTDPTTGLVYLRARDYDPTTGQFLTIDPIIDGTLTPYAYTNNNPLQDTDPTGLCADCNWFENFVQSPAADFLTGPIVALMAHHPNAAMTKHALSAGAGFGDAVTLGISQAVRQGFGADCTIAYDGYYNTANTAGTLLYLGLGLRGTGPTRLPQDVRVNPLAPKPLPLRNRSIGRASHDRAVQARIKDLQAQGATDIRLNQQQINAAGVRVGTNRPDLQYTLNQKRYYEEWDSPRSGRGPGHEKRIRANDPKAGNVELHELP
ncbi:RHS repeat-associated core domain-containing protein [Actinoplanes sp. NPDC049668]|uniref:RHS repeat-associated core domain-containing protein n=1 Tax=unclassified Actinoplanes TaxID=2626549 RepID=UPI0033B117DD